MPRSPYTRYGYRKASMDEIARAAGVSRQGLYLQFANRDDLFRASIDHYYARTLNAALTALADKEQSIDRRLIATFDEWLGQYVGMIAASTRELIADAERLTTSASSKRSQKRSRARR